MTAPDDLTGAWLPGPAQFGAPGCTCRPFTRTDPPRFLDQPGDSVGRNTSWQRGTDCPHHPAQAHRDDEACDGRTQPAADMQRVTALYNRWVKAGPPRIGTPIARWWDARLGELHNAIHPPTEQAKEQP
ncbi:hypothetical protein [Streptomyces canus]|uniref:hypothetical protein n=1 Tax=Streptomyces canus TaxID=58343 RepID=UPI00325679E6